MTVLVAAVLLSVAVAGGLLLGLAHALRTTVPWGAGLAHGALAFAGTVVLGVGIGLAPRGPAVNTALLLFGLALIGGVFNLLFRLQGERPPGFMIGLHGATAAVALAVLWIGIATAG